MSNELIEKYGSIEQAAFAQSFYLHDHGLFDAEILIDELVKQRADLLDALKSMCALYNTDEGTRSLPQYVAAVQAISKAEASE